MIGKDVGGVGHLVNAFSYSTNNFLQIKLTLNQRVVETYRP